MAKNLVIVESPAKAKTIEKFLGSDFEVRASMGHIIDLPKKGIGVDTRRNFEPSYVVIEKKDALLKQLKEASKKAETVYLAPDPDREGEFIAWSLKKMLALRSPRRAVFNEITKRAVQDAIAHPRTIDEDLFNAQQARRVLDRLVGYKISPLLWRRVQRGTSAGRVQSVALRLICEREGEIRAFVPEEYWSITATLSKRQQTETFQAQLIGRQGQSESAAEEDDGVDEATAGKNGAGANNGERAKTKFRVSDEAQAQAILRDLQGAAYVVARVEQKELRRQPFLPYNTSALQQDASVRLRFKPKKTMSVAQDLYEGIALGAAGHQGLITYMRTDSTRISTEAQAAVKQYVAAQFGKDYVGPGRTAKPKPGANVQDAHEAIRPTDVTLTPDQVKPYLSPDQFRLYQLVWRRFVAAFMAPAVFDTTRVDIGAAGYLFRATGSTLKFPGFYAVWPREEDGTLLPPLAAGEPLDLRKLTPDQHFTQPPARFTEASLIKELEERGIGRPSTYVPIVSTIQDRGYVEQQDRRFVPTWLGETVNELMIKHFPEIVDINFTAEMEHRLDEVESGEREWTAFLRDFYDALKEELAKAETEMDRVQKPVEEANETCPQCGKPLLIRSGRFGRFISCSGYPECDFKKPFMIKTGALCPDCGGELVERKSRKSAKVFYGCANYPTCTFAVWDRPLAEPCPECGGLLTLGNGRSEAICWQCGAEVRGATEGQPAVVGHRMPGREAAQAASARRTRRASAAADGAGAENGASPARRTATRSRTTATKRRSTAGASATATRARTSSTASRTRTRTTSAARTSSRAGTSATRRTNRAESAS
ncbi:MAG TPA: type I DNA topoisomerase [Ktedonobacterales bacterium]|nr:type I DNA topoisomerase [Ktedonobacterales bacterium]